MGWGGPEYRPPAEQRAADEAAQAAADARQAEDHRFGVLADAIRVGLFDGLFEIADAIRDAAGIPPDPDPADGPDTMQDDLDRASHNFPPAEPGPIRRPSTDFGGVPDPDLDHLLGGNNHL